MSHHLYNTDAFVLQTFDSGEGSRVVKLFTREFGIINAKAQGVRELKSKMKFMLQDGFYTNVTLVKGREFWRVVNSDNILKEVKREGRIKNIKARTLSLVNRLMQGEDSDPRLFDFIISGFSFMDSKDLSDEQVDNLEAIMVLNTLFYLGYLGENKTIEKLISFEEWTEDILDSVSPVRMKAIEAINTAFNHIQL